jgi:hypothetical protein
MTSAASTFGTMATNAAAFANRGRPRFCKAHYRRILRDSAPPEPLPEWVAEEILPPDGKLDSAAAVNEVLTRVFRCVCEDRLTPRHAACLGYLGQLIISTLPGMERAAANQPPHPLLGRDPDAALLNILHSLSAGVTPPAGAVPENSRAAAASAGADAGSNSPTPASNGDDT